MKGITGNPALDAYHRMGISPVGNARPAERVQGGSQAAVSSPAAQVTISARARDLASESAGSVDPSKVEELRDRIASGNFQVDPRAVANKMMEQLG
ncbi:MAG TPA: flagellar biosynthesis anti-sigma factor FlgM [Polyangiaceae bacterium]|nr:flagellar biosynthesis anti-sigma factor FlgM [Polyangiaceae bacterium]